MTSIYLLKDDKVLLLFRKGGRVVSDVWTGSAGGHVEEFELNDAKACVLREMNEELGLCEDNIRNLSLRYVTLRRTKGEIRQNYYFFAILNEEVSDDLVSNEGELKWFVYKRATMEDIDELVRTRIIVLRAANKLPDDEDMSVVEKESYAYYRRALETGEHIAYLVYDNGAFVGAGGVSFYQVMPTYHNPTGKKAYIMNMYTPKSLGQKVSV